METVGTICEGEWNSSFNGMCSDEADFMAQLLGSCSLPNGAVSSFWAANESSHGGVEESSVYSSEETNGSGMFSFSLGNSIIFPPLSQGSYYPLVNNNSLMAMDYSVIDCKSNVMEGDDFLNQDASDDSVDEKLAQDIVLQEPFKDSHSQISKKRPQIPAGSQRSKRFKKYAKADEKDDSNITTTTTTTTTNVVLHRQSSSGCCSEDDSNASHEANGVKSSSSSKTSGAQDMKGKARASRGSATDPQSLYARKRRERINERLKILQNLVPNGTKVDISTMLEEAVQYVKFLQLQIKLLSSDDLWMYSPIAYNGMDLGLDLKIPSPKPQS